MSTDLLDITLTTLAYGGDALGRLADGRAVFVPFGLPGEVVRVRLTEQREHFARGEIVEVLTASRERIDAKCRHYGKCGGCHYQHMPYASQLCAKAEILRDQLTRIGHITEPRVNEAVGSAQAWNYRNQIQFHVDPQGRLGFMEAGHGDSEAILPIQECHLPVESIHALWPQLQLDPNAGVERVIVRAGSDGETMLVLKAGTPEPPELVIAAGISIVHVYDDEAVVQAGEDHVRLRVLGRNFRVSPTSFFQVNLEVAEKLVKHVLELVPARTNTIIDAYCGVGLFSAFLAQRCQRLIGIESSAAACEDFAANLDEYENVELYEDVVERVLPTLDIQPDLIVVDPPRTGLARKAIDELIRLAPPLIIYVSCDPPTLARDCSRLMAAGYMLEGVTPFDMFPQTYHIESVSMFRRNTTPLRAA